MAEQFCSASLRASILGGRPKQKSTCSAAIEKISVGNFFNQWRSANSSVILPCYPDKRESFFDKHFSNAEEARMTRFFNGNVRPTK